MAALFELLADTPVLVARHAAWREPNEDCHRISLWSIVLRLYATARGRVGVGECALAWCGQLFRSRRLSINRFDRKAPISGESGGGGNRPRVRGRTGQSVYKRSPRFEFDRRPEADALPTA